MTKPNFFKLTLGLTVAITPLTIIAACGTQDVNQTTQQPTTLKKDSFKASDFNFNQTINQAENLITNEWIWNNKHQIFNSIDQLINTNQIKDLKVSNEKNVLTISLKLDKGAYIDANGALANQISGIFSFKITDFATTDQPDAIDLDVIANQATFDVDNKANLKPSQVTKEKLKWNEAQANQKVDFNVVSLLPDDQNGKLGFQVIFSQRDLPTNAKQLSVLPNTNQAVSGFMQSLVEPSDQEKLDKEIARLQNEQASVINASQLTNIEVENFKKNPANFKQHLTNLSSDNKFNYEVVQFSVDNQKAQKMLNIDLFVKYQSASKTVKLSKAIDVVEVNFNDPTWLQKAEKNRLDNLALNSILLKTTFSEQEVSQWKQKPNQVLNHLFNFVSTFGFHYQVQELNFGQFDAQTGKTKLTFKIAAKLWKAANKPVITSNQFSFDVVVNKTQDEEVKPPVATTKGWKIEPNDKSTPELNPDGSFAGSYNLTIDLQQDEQIDFALLNPENSEELIYKLFEAKKDLFIKVSGDLPNDWDWKNYTYFQYMNDNLNDQNQLNGFQYYLQFDHVDSNLLDDPTADNILIINLDLINGYNSGNQPAKPTEQEIWDGLKKEFGDLIKNQAIDDDKLHLDWSGNGIMGFAQLGYENPSKSDHFSNFLNFSPTEFRIKNKHLIDVKVKDASINYLTNTIKFTWVLEGLNNRDLGVDLSNYQEEFTGQTIQYQPKDKWQDSINFNNSDSQLTIPGSVSLNNILDRFGLSNKFVSETNLKEKFKEFGKNWTWKARELVNYIRFTFFQAFNDGADAINMGLIGINPTTTSLNDNPQNYQIILKAKLNDKAQGTYLPFLQQFGSGIGAQPRAWQSGEIIEIRLNVNSIPTTPDVVMSANEIFPGISPGNVLGTGQGANQAYLNSPPRNDIYNIALGSHTMDIKVNNNPYVSNLKANHRFIAFNMLSRYNYQDPITPEPNPEQGWVS